MLRLYFSLAMLTIVGCSSCSPEPVPTTITHTACNIALDYMKQFRDQASKPIAVSQRSEGLSPSRHEIEEFLRSEPAWKDDPEFLMMLAASDIRDVNVVEQCSVVQDWLKDKNILHDDQQIEKISREVYWSVDVLSMTVPIISQDGSIAQIYTSEFSGQLGGATYAVTFEKSPNGSWSILRKEALTIS